MKRIRRPHHRRTIFSRAWLLVGGVTAILLGCAQNDPALEVHHALVRRSIVSAEYPEISIPPLTRYLNTLTTRITESDPRCGQNTPPFLVNVVDTAKPLAVSLGAHQVVISWGTVLATTTEAELAFIIAHEIAHDLLGHLAGSSDVEAMDPFSDYSIDLEIRADKRGLACSMLAGFDPRPAVAALPRLAATSVRHSASPAALNASIEKRVHELRTLVEGSGWSPPGTVTRREFILLRRMLEREARSR